MNRVIGVCAVQGDFERHLDCVALAGEAGLAVRTPEDLNRVTHLILPGGESTTVGLLLERYGLGDAIQARCGAGMPIWGTCMGTILMANRLENPQIVAGRTQYTLRLLDITVRRNAFGAQVHSFEAPLAVKGLEVEATGVFIRAPIVTEMGPDVEPIAWFEDRVVAVRQGVRLGTSFHPELTDDPSFHAWFATF